MIRWLLPFLSLIGIAAALFLKNTLSREIPKPPIVEQPASNPYVKGIAASGIVESALNNIAISPPIAGLVTKLNADVGDKVKKGDPLFTIDPRELEANLLVQKADVFVQDKLMARLSAQLQLLESVKDPRAVSVDEVTTRRNDLQVAEAQLLKSEADMKKTELLIERLTVRAPRDGIILQNNLEEGEYAEQVSAGRQSLPSMVLGNTDKLQVRVDVDEQNASRVRANTKAIAYPKNNPNIEVPLKFAYIEPYVIPKKSLTGNPDERVDTRVLQVVYYFEPSEDNPLYVGQQVDVYIDAP